MFHHLFECAPFSSCFDNFLCFNFLFFTTHNTCVVVSFNICSLGSALIDVVSPARFDAAKMVLSDGA